jgi:hypothetical protein
MAGTFVSDTIQNGAGATVPTTTVINGSAKAWGSYTTSGAATVPTLNRSYNITSITQSSQGVYVFALTTALPDANYAVILNNTYPATNNSPVGCVIAKTTSTFTTFGGYVSNFGASATPYSWGMDFVVLG